MQGDQSSMPGAVDHGVGDNGQDGDIKGVVIGGVDVEDAMFVAKRKMQIFLDRIAFYPGRRWACFFGFLFFFLTRMYIQQGYAVIAYLLGLFYLNNIMLYLAPADDPDDLEFNADKNESILPDREQDEYKGFQRKLHELEFWQKMMTATLIASFFSCF